jgi:hypothetical protein
MSIKLFIDEQFLVFNIQMSHENMLNDCKLQGL